MLSALCVEVRYVFKCPKRSLFKAAFFGKNSGEWILALDDRIENGIFNSGVLFQFLPYASFTFLVQIIGYYTCVRSIRIPFSLAL